MIRILMARFASVLSIDTARAMRFAIWGGVGGIAANLLSEPLWYVPFLSERALVPNLILGTLTDAVNGALVTTALVLCHRSRNGLSVFAPVAVTRAASVGLIAGAVSGFVSELVYQLFPQTEFLRIICWGLDGAMLGFGLAPRLPNLPRMRAVLGGGIGGVVGCLLFIPLKHFAGGTVGRILGIPALGFFIGLMIVFADSLLRSAWLDLRYPNGRSGTLTLGDDWVAIGTDERAVAVYAHGAPPIGLRYRLANGQVTCEEPARGFAGPVSPGDQRTTGQVSATLRTSTTVPVSASSSSSSSSTTTSPAPQPPMQDRSTPPSATPRTVSIQLRRDTCRIGSASTCEVLVRASGVAQVHAEVRRSPGRTIVAPTGSSRLEVSFSGNPADFRTVTGETTLKDGSRLRFGDASATYHDAPSRLEVTS